MQRGPTLRAPLLWPKAASFQTSFSSALATQSGFQSRPRLPDWTITVGPGVGDAKLDDSPPGKKNLRDTTPPTSKSECVWGVRVWCLGLSQQRMGRCAGAPCNTSMLIGVLVVLVCWFVCCGVWCPPWGPSASFGWSPLPRSCWSVGRTSCGDMRLLPL